MGDVPTVVGPYSLVTKGAGLLFVSGQIGIKDGSLVEGGVAAQTRQAMNNLEAVLATEGAKFSDVLKTTIYVTDMSTYATVNDVYAEALGGHRPARATVAVAALPAGAEVEIEAVAIGN